MVWEFGVVGFLFLLFGIVQGCQDQVWSETRETYLHTVLHATYNYTRSHLVKSANRLCLVFTSYRFNRSFKIRTAYDTVTRNILWHYFPWVKPCHLLSSRDLPRSALRKVGWQPRYCLSRWPVPLWSWDPQALRRAIDLIQTLGVAISEGKSVLIPVHKLVYLGFKINTCQMTGKLTLAAHDQLVYYDGHTTRVPEG